MTQGFSFTVLNYDRRGRGGSGDTDPYSVDREIEDLQAVANVVGGEVNLFGTSGGAFLAFKAVSAGMPCAHIAAWEPPYIVEGSRPPVPVNYAEQQAALADKDDRGAMVDLFMSGAVGMPAEFVAGLRQGPFWGFLEAAASPALVYDAKLAGDFSVNAEELARVSCPVLVLDGATTGWLTQGADAAAAAIPDVVRNTLTGQQHNVEAAALAPALATFFTS